jgi:hypothetical protein
MDGTSNGESRLEPPAGEWLFKLQGEVLGPAPSSEIIQRMYTGEIDESTQVSSGDGDWGAIQGVRGFRPFLARAKAKIRAEHARVEAERAARRRRTRNMILVAIGAVILVIVSFVASFLLIVHRPFDSESNWRSWAMKHVPLLAVPKAQAATQDAQVSDREMDNGKINIDQILIDDAPALVGLRQGLRNGTTKKPGAVSHKGKEAAQPSESAADGSGSLSNEEIMSVVFNKANLRRLYGCIQSEISRNADLPSPLIVSFTIREDGRIGEVRMDEYRLNDTPLHSCFKERLSGLKFRAFQGERRNIEIPFNIGNK